MAEKTRSSIIGVKEETTEGTLIELGAGTDFTEIREGFSVQGQVETVESDALVNSIGASEPFVTKEIPSSSIPKYLKHSGVEGQAPDYAIMIKSSMGSQTTNATEYNTIAGSTAGTSAVAGTVVVDTGEGANFAEGQALLIKDGANGYNIRNVKSISSDTLTLNYNLASAPALGVNLGKAIHFSPSVEGHPTYSLHHYQASTSSSLHQALAGCRTTSMSLEFPANDLASISFEIEGIKYFYNPIIISASNNKINFKDVSLGSELTATLSNKAYQTPIALAEEISTKMTAASTNGDTFTATYDSQTGLFTIATDGAYFDLMWATGTNGSGGTDTHAGTILGFSDVADDTGSTSYVADGAQTYDPAYTPSLDSSSAFVVKNQELLIGSFDRKDCRPASSVSISIGTAKSDVNNICAESGVSESVVNSRQVELSTTLIFQEHEAQEMHNLVNNTTSQLMFNAGVKNAAGNWVAGKCFNFYMPNMKINSNVISDDDGIIIVEMTATGFVTSGDKDLHMNFL